MDAGQYFAYKGYFNTIIGPWDLSRIVDNGRLYILTEYNVFWTGLARSGLVRTGPAWVRPGSLLNGIVLQFFWIFLIFSKFRKIQKIIKNWIAHYFDVFQLRNRFWTLREGPLNPLDRYKNFEKCRFFAIFKYFLVVCS